MKTAITYETDAQEKITICEHDFDPMRKINVIFPKIKMTFSARDALTFSKTLELEAQKLIQGKLE